MNRATKGILVFCMGMIAVPGIVLCAKLARLRCRNDRGGMAGRSVYSKLQDSKVALDKAMSLIRSAMEDL